MTSVVTAAVLPRPVGDRAARAEIALSPDEPAFAGHFPDFPVLPGVCLIEIARRAADRCLPDLGCAEVTSARFTGAVRPGDTLRVDLKWTGDGPADCTVTVRAGADRVATVRLRYTAEARP
ncbi:3-hydroxyacyl-ACP dehydratase FabZ family protein [Goodfellowiella coeruleoviolacea]|uniref:3-hydroxyacyl-[acyl-carrier-protein] dehydratase n=1 Tax=Goodfellowiella coeruleoviolacea TaxID=334858 RepID=A0AAE3GF54_9PSEU|nr:MaoC/PaaZ C-terminal domain-containing protein [Goodfellowiella coeruleoviolacea]MCP2167071.1 3-hydroxyacyl-[acyl-carrier-protein] dehydratase [Goodfellowiella coeruleoviolacea]